MHTKPLYEAQKQIEYQRHTQRLKQIATKKFKQSQLSNTNSEVEDQGGKHYSSYNKISQRAKAVSYENYKLLGRLQQISNRRVTPTSPITSHILKKPTSIKVFNNPQRKRRQQQILQMNKQLARRLITKQSEFQKNKMMKSIEDYKNMRKILQNNKRVKLLPLQKQSGGYLFSRISTIQNMKPECHIQRFKSQMSSLQLDVPQINGETIIIQ